jgi:oxygen-independent coproporphyrinogen III oxidase
MAIDLLKKYNIPAPRYTSYPTVPFWQEEPPTQEEWISNFKTTFQKNGTISLYIHLPFCESMCTFCGCTKRITKNHQVEHPYIESLLKEWQLYLRHFDKRPIIKEIHLGGGTPTFFQPENLAYLINGIMEHADRADDYEFGFEAHPDSTSEEHLETLFELGFRRISIGVQDFDNEILKIINRHQSYESVERVTLRAKELGYHSINFDLVFGLPLQTKEHIEKTIQKVNILRPDRIAFYSYAHVPWVKPGQRAYSEADLPLGAAKRDLYEFGRQMLEDSGYHEIGMDHFALSSDELYKAKANKHLHRNFMGYTPLHTDLMIGLGASSISDSLSAFVQNEKKIETYQQLIDAQQFPIIRGHLLNEEDQNIRLNILELMCQGETSLSDTDLSDADVSDILLRLQPLEADGLVQVESREIKVKTAGLPLIRNICMAFDMRMHSNPINGELFSQAV